MIASVLLIAYAVWGFAFSEPDERLLLAPIAVSSISIAVMLEYFWRRDRHLPIVDVGVLGALITLVYVATPTLFYIKSGLTWTDLSDKRLFEINATPQDVADILWLVAAYLTAFCFTYGLLRGQGMPGPEIKLDIRPEHGWALLCILLLAIAYQIGIERTFGVNLNPSNEALQEETVHLPLFIAQITHNIVGIGRIAKLGLIAFAISRKSWLMAGALLVWLLLEGYSAATTLGARTYFAVLLMVAILAIHRMIRTFGPLLSASVAAVFIAGLLLFGYVRDGGLRPDQITDVWSAANEFQVLLANGIHIPWAHDHGIINEIPWQVKLSDLIMLVPQQLLPFRKLDPSEWYLDQIGLADQGLGLMFGVVAQAKVGYGVLEIIIRGAVLGAVLAFIHRKCVKHANSFTAFIVYLWLCTSIYYTYRATTFYIATWAVYRLIPFVLLFWFLIWMFRSRTAQSNSSVQAPIEP